MARDVLSLRLNDDERALLEQAAKKQRVSLSEFLRRCALLVAFRLEHPQTDEPKRDEQRRSRGCHIAVTTPGPTPEPPHAFTTYRSFEDYRATSPYASSGPAIPPGGALRDV